MNHVEMKQAADATQNLRKLLRGVFAVAEQLDKVGDLGALEAELQAKIDPLRAAIDVATSELGETLANVSAVQRERENVLKAAKDDAARIVEQARSDAKGVVADARSDAARVAEDAHIAVEGMKAEMESAQRARDVAISERQAEEVALAALRREVANIREQVARL